MKTDKPAWIVLAYLYAPVYFICSLLFKTASKYK